jgi:predicted DNA-binding transcriptional regulator AlpA
MTELEVMQTAIARAMTRAHPPVIMSLEDVADCLGMSYNHVRNTVQHEPGFPPKLDRFKSPRWSREDILAWAMVSAQ